MAFFLARVFPAVAALHVTAQLPPRLVLGVELARGAVVALARAGVAARCASGAPTFSAAHFGLRLALRAAAVGAAITAAAAAAVRPPAPLDELLAGVDTLPPRCGLRPFRNALVAVGSAARRAVVAPPRSEPLFGPAAGATLVLAAASAAWLPAPATAAEALVTAAGVVARHAALLAAAAAVTAALPPGGPAVEATPGATRVLDTLRARLTAAHSPAAVLRAACAAVEGVAVSQVVAVGACAVANAAPLSPVVVTAVEVGGRTPAARARMRLLLPDAGARVASCTAAAAVVAGAVAGCSASCDTLMLCAGAQQVRGAQRSARATPA